MYPHKNATTGKELHENAMWWYEASLVNRHCAAAGYSCDLADKELRKALSLETKAAMLLKDRLDVEPTRSELLLSAATMAWQLGKLSAFHQFREFNKAKRLIELALQGTPESHIVEELNELTIKCSQLQNT